MTKELDSITASAAPRNVLAEWIIEENPSVSYADLEGIPSGVLTAMYPNVYPSGSEWKAVNEFCFDIAEGPTLEKYLAPFATFWSKQILRMEDLTSYFPGFPEGLEMMGAIKEPTFATATKKELSEIPARLPEGWIAATVESSLDVGGAFSFELLPRDSDVSAIQTGLKISAVLLLTANENGLGTRTWEQHENALAPLVQLLEELRLFPLYSELPFTRPSKQSEGVL